MIDKLTHKVFRFRLKVHSETMQQCTVDVCWATPK